MDSKEAKRIVDYVFKDVFGADNPYSLEESMYLYAYDVPLPHKAKANVKEGEETWGDFPKGAKVTSQADLILKSAKDEFMKPKKQIGSIDELVKMWEDINIFTGERYLDSKEVSESDAIYNSYGVYRSLMQNSSQYIVYGYNNKNSKYLVGSRDNDACVNGIRMDDNYGCSSSYEVVWSKKVSKSLFINNCYDLYECMFCNNIRSKKYCIGNMQYTQEEYMKVKRMVVEWILDDFAKRAKKL